MTLTTRISLFFLGALALALAGFSVSLCLLARAYLSREVHERLEATLGVLAGAAEMDDDGIEWEPHGDWLAEKSKKNQAHWLVLDGQGEVVDRSPSLSAAEAMHAALAAFSREPRRFKAVTLPMKDGGQRWQFAQQLLTARTGAQRGRSADANPRHGMVVLLAAEPMEPMFLALRNLALLSGGLSLAMWLLSAAIGRKLCRRALAPVAEMAAAARSMRGADLEQRLPAPGAKDELLDFAAAFNDLLDRVQEAFERQRQFTGNASHQLRTPLTILLGQVEVALRRERTADEYRRVLGVLRSQAVELRQLVETLMFLARADAEARLPDLEPLDLADWLPEHAATWSEHPRAGDVQLALPAEHPGLVEVHPALLAQALDNLFDNACKYSRLGAPIVVRLAGEPGETTLAIEDRGCGIAAEDLPHLFEPFYRSSEARKAGLPGAGLGLTVAARVAAAFGGRVEVESRPGEGSRFVLHLPSLAAATGLRSPASLTS
ncbi:MAG TPA: HAMP domain-containing sensor histidine kinase [Pirellulales bacterium]|nr:HAMP domain-containing sensor histidine kinase [Pirellulales bacterium]